MLNYLMNQILYLGGAKKSILTYAPAVFGGQPFLKPFLKTSRLFELEAVDSKLQIFPGKFWSWKKTRLKWLVFLPSPFKNAKDQSRKGGR